MTVPTVLVLVDSMNVGGVERQVIELLKGLRLSGRYHTALSIINRGGLWDIEALRMAEMDVGVRRESYLDTRFPLRLIQQAKRKGVRLVHTFGWMSAVVGLFAARWLRIPVVNASVQNAAPFVWHHRVGAWCARWSDAAIANSKAGLKGYGLAQCSKASIIHNGVDLNRFAHVVPMTFPGPTICMVANFSKNKDHGTLIRALPGIQRELSAVRLALIGRDAGTLQENRALVDELAVGSAVEFFTNVTHPEPYIAGSVLCVLASSATGEGIANAIIEYMAIGKPVIATDCEGNREVVVEGKNGFLVPGGCAEMIAEHAVLLLRSPRRALWMGNAGRELIHREFSLTRMVAQYEALYDKLLSSRL